MSFAPDTPTTRAQRDTELLLLNFLRSTNPHLFALWNHHPEQWEEDTEDGSDGDGIPAALSTPFVYEEPSFYGSAHSKFLRRHLRTLPSEFSSLHPAQPWIVCWALQAADMLGVVESHVLASTPLTALVDFLHSCLSVDYICQAELNHTVATEAAAGGAPVDAGTSMRPVMGFAGGPSLQGPHLLTSYGACCALVILSHHDGGASLRQLPRAAIKRWLLCLRNSDGSFRVCGGGETDIRASYCAAALTQLLSLDDPSTFDEDVSGGEIVDDVRDVPVLTLQTARFVAACQTHEGGFTCKPVASESHGAYTHCGLAALLLMKQPHLVHQAPLRRWLAARQLNTEGGFNGRTNKLVDSCYSYWIGASHVLLRTIEAYNKCFVEDLDESAVDGTEEPHSDPRETVNEHAGGAGAAMEECTSSSGCLRAREVVLLDHAQLLDASHIQACDESAWDRAEEEEFHRQDLVDCFLGADDEVLRRAAAARATKLSLYEQLWMHEESAVTSQEVAEEAVQAWRSHQAYLYAPVGDFYFNQRKLLDYILRCCQSKTVGGLMDKPGTAHDAYHTCYALSGMSAAQNLQYTAHVPPASPYLARAFDRAYLPPLCLADGKPESVGVVSVLSEQTSTAAAAAQSMLLRRVNPIFNLHPSSVLSALRVFGVRTYV